jgi:putative DNA primase/helicase
MSEPTMLEAALGYAEKLGWKVFPCHSITEGRCTCGDPACTSPGKHPRTVHGCKDASSDRAVIVEWWRRSPNSNIAVATGEPSGVDVLDVDPRHGGDETLRALELEHGELPATPMSTTGGGGWHRFFKHTPGLANSAGKLGPGLDWRTTGGFVILPPSQHISGRRYVWECASRPEEITAARLPEALLKLASTNGNGRRKAHATPFKIPILVKDGTKHDTCVSLAGSMRWRGCNSEEIYAALLKLAERFETPVPPEKLRRIAESVERLYEPAELPEAVPAFKPEGETAAQFDVHATPELLSQHFSDYGNSRRVIGRHGERLRYCHAFAKWLVWDGRRWAVDDGERARDLAQEAMLEFARQALVAKNETAAKFAAGCLNSQRISNALREAQPHLAIRPGDLDNHADLLNCTNGTLDLKTGRLREHRREDFITKLVHHDYRPGADCPVFLAFLERVTANHPGLVGYLQRAFGYSLTAHTIEKAVFLLHGRGDNGKSTLLTAFLKIVEEYGVLLQIDTLMARPESNNTQADLADLRGARFAMTSETEEGQRLAEGKLKRITQGMGRIKATRKYENPVEFTESHKLWIDANHLPVVRGTDNAIWNRLHPVPFDITIPMAEQEKDLPVKLAAEADGILSWAVAGAVRWYSEGLGKPPDVERAGVTWRAQSDQIGRFIAERCVTAGFAQAQARPLYLAYRTWAEQGGEDAVSETAFGNTLQEKGFSKRHTEHGSTYSGIGLTADDP